MKTKHVLITLAILMLTAIAVFASTGVDDRGNPNDPAINERANACYEGGTMEGKCGTTDIDENGSVEQWEVDWHYECGWYLIRYEYGMIGEDAGPDGCLYTPAEPASVAPASPAVVPSCDTDLSVCPT